jgi:hypothetical protein
MDCLRHLNEDQLKSKAATSLRSRRQNLAQGEASAASGTLGSGGD